MVNPNLSQQTYFNIKLITLRPEFFNKNLIMPVQNAIKGLESEDILNMVQCVSIKSLKSLVEKDNDIYSEEDVKARYV